MRERSGGSHLKSAWAKYFRDPVWKKKSQKEMMEWIKV
jgi:hypothetical protein